MLKVIYIYCTVVVLCFIRGTTSENITNIDTNFNNGTQLTTAAPTLEPTVPPTKLETKLLTEEELLSEKLCGCKDCCTFSQPIVNHRFVYQSENELSHYDNNYFDMVSKFDYLHEFGNLIMMPQKPEKNLVCETCAVGIIDESGAVTRDHFITDDSGTFCYYEFDYNIKNPTVYLFLYDLEEDATYFLQVVHNFTYFSPGSEDENEDTEVVHSTPLVKNWMYLALMFLATILLALLVFIMIWSKCFCCLHLFRQSQIGSTDVLDTEKYTKEESQTFVISEDEEDEEDELSDIIEEEEEEEGKSDDEPDTYTEIELSSMK